MSHGLSHHVGKVTTTPEYVKILTLRTIGNFLVLSSLFMIGKTFYQPFAQEVKYFRDTFIHKRYVIATTIPSAVTDKPIPTPTAEPVKGGLAGLLKVNQVEVIQPVDAQFGI